MQRAGGGVHIQHHARQILDKNRVRRIGEQVVEPPLAVVQVILGAHPLQRAAAMVRQRLQRDRIAFRVTVRAAVLHEEHADDAFALADGRDHRRAGALAGLRRRDDLRPACDDAPHNGVGVLWLSRGGDFHALAVNRRDGKQRDHLVLFRRIQIQRKVVPVKKFIRRLADALRRLQRRRGRA